MIEFSCEFRASVACYIATIMFIVPDIFDVHDVSGVYYFHIQINPIETGILQRS